GTGGTRRGPAESGAATRSAGRSRTGRRRATRYFLGFLRPRDRLTRSAYCHTISTFATCGSRSYTLPSWSSYGRRSIPSSARLGGTLSTRTFMELCRTEMAPSTRNARKVLDWVVLFGFETGSEQSRYRRYLVSVHVV